MSKDFVLLFLCQLIIFTEVKSTLISEDTGNWTKCQKHFWHSFKVKNWDMCLETPSKLYGGDFRTQNISGPNEILDKGLFEKRSCFCDKDCGIYGDCCADISKLFSHTKRQYEIDRWDCLDLPNGHSRRIMAIYMIGKCPTQWDDADVCQKCERDIENIRDYKENIPVFSVSTRVTYKNIFCAICNQDTDLERWNISMTCEGDFVTKEILSGDKYINPQNYVPDRRVWSFRFRHRFVTCTLTVFEFGNSNEYANKYNARVCRKNVKTCPKSWVGSEEEKNCKDFASYRYRYGRVYRNKHCATCNGISSADLKCLRLRSGRQGGRVRLYGARMGTRPRKTYKSFNLLFDFNFNSGNHIGTVESRCPVGEIYDPLKNKCILVHCGRLFKHVQGKCVRDPNSKFSNNSLASDCHTTMISPGQYTILPNNTVWVNQTNRLYGQGEYDLFESSMELYICLEENHAMIFKFSSTQGLLSTICLHVSIVCLTLHIFIYALLPKLRNVPGKNLLSLSVSLLVAQLLFLYGVDSHVGFSVCYAISVATHFFFLAYFFWMNVLAIDICYTFKSDNHRSDLKKSNFVRFSLYGWLAPTLLVSFSVLADQTSFIPLSFRPGYGRDICWITHRKSLLLFFAFPIALLIIVNFILFTSTAYYIWKSTKITQKAIKRPGTLRYILYVKLALVMGMTWITAFVAAFADRQILYYAYIVFNGLQGFFIFAAFTCKKRVCSLLKKRLRSLKEDGMQPKRSRKESTGSGTLVTNLSNGTSFHRGISRLYSSIKSMTTASDSQTSV